MTRRLLLSLCMITPFAQFLTSRDQGYFDLGFGSTFVEDVKINLVTTEYYPGPAIQTSVGVAYRNGLGLGLLYSFAYNKVKGEDIADDLATELINSEVVLNFTYKVMPSTAVTFFFDGGPGLMINSDQSLKSTATTETASTVTTTDGSGTLTSTVTTTNSDQASSTYESIDNFSFGYRMGGGIEYREDIHKAFIFQIHYTNTNIFKTTFTDTNARRVSSSVSDTMESYNGSLTMRYYF